MYISGCMDGWRSLVATCLPEPSTVPSASSESASGKRRDGREHDHTYSVTERLAARGKAAHRQRETMNLFTNIL